MASRGQRYIAGTDLLRCTYCCCCCCCCSWGRHHENCRPLTELGLLSSAGNGSGPKRSLAVVLVGGGGRRDVVAVVVVVVVVVVVRHVPRLLLRVTSLVVRKYNYGGTSTGRHPGRAGVLLCELKENGSERTSAISFSEPTYDMMHPTHQKK